MQEVLKTKENIKDIALAYKNEDGYLEEVDERFFYLSVEALSYKKVKLYLIGDYIYHSNIRIEANIYETDGLTVALSSDLTEDLNSLKEGGNSLDFFYDLQENNQDAIPFILAVFSNSLIEKEIEINLRVEATEII